MPLCWEKDLLLTAWDSGYFELPPIPVAYAVQSGIDTVFTQPLTLQVYLTPPDTAVSMPLKPIYPANRLKAELYPLFDRTVGSHCLFRHFMGHSPAEKTGAGSSSATGARRRAAPCPGPGKIPPTGKEAQLWQKGLVKEYHTQLTFILREYLEARFGILAWKTPRVRSPNRWSTRSRKPSAGKMTALLNTSDMVKFAKAEPPDSIHPELLDNARKLITYYGVVPSGHEPQVTSH